jgi:signal transduction histidine kinase
MSGENMRWIQDIHESTMRLSRLNQALLLLTRIENRQYHEKETLNLSQIINTKLGELDEIFTHKGITATHTNNGSFMVDINPALADVLITNLLNNAVKHNLSINGVVSILSENSQLTFQNTGPALSVPPQELFERFRKQNATSGSLGLGLAIVKTICTVYDLDITYSMTSDLHTIVIKKT